MLYGKNSGRITPLRQGSIIILHTQLKQLRVNCVCVRTGFSSNEFVLGANPFRDSTLCSSGESNILPRISHYNYVSIHRKAPEFKGKMCLGIITLSCSLFSESGQP